MLEIHLWVEQLENLIDGVLPMTWRKQAKHGQSAIYEERQSLNSIIYSIYEFIDSMIGGPPVTGTLAVSRTVWRCFHPHVIMYKLRRLLRTANLLIRCEWSYILKSNGSNLQKITIWGWNLAIFLSWESTPRVLHSDENNIENILTFFYESVFKRK